MSDPVAASPILPAGRTDRPEAIGLAAHILPTSATMIGVCLTMLYISLLRTVGTRRTVVDNLMAVDALVFLASALLSFMSMRSRRLASRFEALAETVFIAELSLLALGAALLAFAVT